MYLSFLVQPGAINPVVKLFVVDTDNTTNIAEVLVPAAFRNMYGTVPTMWLNMWHVFIHPDISQDNQMIMFWGFFCPQ